MHRAVWRSGPIRGKRQGGFLRVEEKQRAHRGCWKNFLMGHKVQLLGVFGAWIWLDYFRLYSRILHVICKHLCTARLSYCDTKSVKYPQNLFLIQKNMHEKNGLGITILKIL